MMNEMQLQALPLKGMRALVTDGVRTIGAGNNQGIGQAVVFLCSKQSSYITGEVLTFNGGLGISEVFAGSLKVFKSGTGTAL